MRPIMRWCPAEPALCHRPSRARRHTIRIAGCGAARYRGPMLPDHLDWTALADGLDQRGWSVLPRLLTHDACTATAALYDEPQRFRSRVVMARHGFGRGEYQYFAAPLPEPVATLRA